MKHKEDFLRQARGVVQKLGIHPLVLALGAVFCLFFPRFFLLADLGGGVWWVAKNIWFDPRRRGRGRGGRRS
jgi:hypothetical protein